MELLLLSGLIYVPPLHIVHIENILNLIGTNKKRNTTTFNVYTKKIVLEFV